MEEELIIGLENLSFPSSSSCGERLETEAILMVNGLINDAHKYLLWQKDLEKELTRPASSLTYFSFLSLAS